MAVCFEPVRPFSEFTFPRVGVSTIADTPRLCSAPYLPGSGHKTGRNPPQIYRTLFFRLPLDKNTSPLRSPKVSGVTIILIVHCLAHDIDIRLLAIQFGQLITGVCHAG